MFRLLGHVLPDNKSIWIGLTMLYGIGLQKSKKFEHNEFIKRWMPMVKAACIKFYKEHEEDLSGDPNDLFSKDMRKVLCQRLADQHHKDIEAGEYKLS